MTVIVGLSSISEQKQLTWSHNSDLTARKWAKLSVIYLITRRDVSNRDFAKPCMELGTSLKKSFQLRAQISFTGFIPVRVAPWCTF